MQGTSTTASIIGSQRYGESTDQEKGQQKAKGAGSSRSPPKNEELIFGKRTSQYRQIHLLFLALIIHIKIALSYRKITTIKCKIIFLPLLILSGE